MLSPSNAVSFNSTFNPLPLIERTSFIQDLDSTLLNGQPLPHIVSSSNGMQSPFKSFLDISIVQQKLRKALKSQEGRRPFMSYEVAQRMQEPTTEDASTLETQAKGTRFQAQDK